PIRGGTGALHNNVLQPKLPESMYEAPAFTLEPQGGEAPITLTVSVTGLPIPKITWYSIHEDHFVTVDGAHEATDTVIAVEDASGVTIGLFVVLDTSEIMCVTAVEDNNLTVQRGCLGTTPVALEGG